MPRDDFDGASIATQESTSSVTSTIWSKIPSSSRKVILPLDDLCSYLRVTTDMEHSPIEGLIIRKEEDGVQHEFLLILLYKPSGGEFWMRLERKRPTGALGRLLSGVLEANDIATVSGIINSLLGKAKSVQKSKVSFHNRPSLRDLFHVLEALGQESKSYTLWPQNCYFFASVIAEHLCSLDEACEISGGLRWLDLGGAVRDTIRRMISESSSQHTAASSHENYPKGNLQGSLSPDHVVDTEVKSFYPEGGNSSFSGWILAALTKDLENLALVTHDISIHTIVMRLVRIVETQDRLLHCCDMNDTRAWKGLGEYLVELLEDCRNVVYEHLHFLSEIPGARKLRSSFSADLIHGLDEWEKSTSKDPDHAMSQDDSHKFGSLVNHHLSTAFDDAENTQLHHSGLRWIQEISSSSDLELALWTIEHLSFCEALEGLSWKNRYQLKQDVIGLKATFNKDMPEKAQFACKSWSLLVCRVDCNDPRIIQALDHFIRKLLPHWIVAMGLMDGVDAVCLDLYHVGNWMRSSSTLKEHRVFISHIHRFILRSKQALSQCPFLVFTGSLPFEVEPFTKAGITPSFATIASYDAIWVSAGASQDTWSLGPMRRRTGPRSVSCVAYSPDSTRLVSASRDRDVDVWCTSTGALLHTLRTPFACVFVTFSPDGLQVACASESNCVYICDVEKDTSIVTLFGHSKRVNSLAYSPCGTRLASASKDRTIRVWDLVGGSLLFTLQKHFDAVVSVAFSCDGALLASASFDEYVHIWNGATGYHITSLLVNSAVSCIAFHPDNERVVFACKDKSVRIWDIHSTGAAVRLEGHNDAVYSVSCSPDGTYIASASVDNTVQLRNVSNSRHIRTLKGHTDEVYSVAFSPDSMKLVSGSRDCSIRIWNVNAFNPPDESKSFTIAVSSNRRIVAAVSRSRDILLIDSKSESSKYPTKLCGHTDSVTSACFSPDDTLLVTTSRDLTMCVWEVASGRCVKNIVFESAEGRLKAPYHMSYSTDGLVLRILGSKILVSSEEPVTIYFDAQKWNAIPDVPQATNFPGTYLPERSFPVVLQQNCLCVRRRDSLAYLCWLPDDFKPISDVLQTGRRVTIGGKCGDVVHVSFEDQDLNLFNCM